VLAILAGSLSVPVADAQTGCNVIIGTAGDDTLMGTEGNDCIAGLGGDDDISDSGGDDRITGGDGDDFVSGGRGNDWIDGGSGDDVIDSDSGNDDIVGGIGDDDIDGLGGDDRISGDGGDDFLVGGEDNDNVVGGDGDDLLDDAFDEPLETASSDDVLVGGTGDDELFGGAGSDRLAASDGLAGETVDGGDGRDICADVDHGDLVSNCESGPGTAITRAATAQATGPTATLARRAPLRMAAITWNVHEVKSHDQQIADVLADAVGRGRGNLKMAALQEMCFNQTNDVVESENRLEDQTGRDWSWEDSEPYGNYLDFPASIKRCNNGNVVLASVPGTSSTNVFRKRFETQEEGKCVDDGADDLETECRNYVRFDVTFGGRTVRVYSVHIGGPDSVKSRQIRELAADIRSERYVVPRIVMGDFDVRPGDTFNGVKMLKPMRRLFRDVLGNTKTATGSAGPCPSLDTGNRIDYIFIRRIRKERAYVPPMSDERNVSDHCPVVAKLLVP